MWVTPLCYSWARNLCVEPCPAAWAAAPLLYHVPPVIQNHPPEAWELLEAKPISEGLTAKRSQQGVPQCCFLLWAELSVAEKPQKWVSTAASAGTILVPHIQCTSFKEQKQKEQNREENLRLIKAKLVCTVYLADESFRSCNIPLRLFLCYFKNWNWVSFSTRPHWVLWAVLWRENKLAEKYCRRAITYLLNKLDVLWAAASGHCS